MSLLLLIGGATAANSAPVLTTTDPLTAYKDIPVSMGASVVDDGLPTGTLTNLWTFVSGPGGVLFVDDTDPNTNATFDTIGVYVVNLAASDGALSSDADVTVNVSDPPTTGTDRWGKWMEYIWH